MNALFFFLLDAEAVYPGIMVEASGQKVNRDEMPKVKKKGDTAWFDSLVEKLAGDLRTEE